MIKVAIVGATGYAGEELLKILVNHSGVKITSVSAKIDQPQKISQIFPDLSGKINLICAQPVFSKIIPKCDLAFLALPHRISMEIAPKFIQAGKKIIDLSADYRLKDKFAYKKWYGTDHKNPNYLTQAVYGLPEINRKKIKKAKIIANPGCYPTGAILGCLPFLAKGIAQEENIIVDAKSGLSGAGREKEAMLLSQMQNNFRAYKVDAHQHAPEINQELTNFNKRKIEVTFIPHLIPIQRGILSTIYFQLKSPVSEKEMQDLYQDFYRQEPYVKILPGEKFPDLKEVAKTNFCHIGVKVSQTKRTAIVISAIDNLVKGASGQAVQNMNIMCGFKEREGLG